MALEVTREAIDAMMAEARKARSHEACGLLLGADGRIDSLRPAANVHPKPETRFEIDPQMLIDAHRAARQGGPQIIGYYHSHPSGPAEPSDTDRERSAGDGCVWAIVGDGGIGFWRDEPAGFVPLSYRIAGS